MLSKTFGLLFYLKKQKNYVRGKQPIYMRITVDYQRAEISTKREIEPERWNSPALNSIRSSRPLHLTQVEF